jgi:predicted esterase
LTQEQLEAIAIQPARRYEETGSLVVPAMLPLFKEESITYTGKKKYENAVLKYRLHVPESLEPGKKYPLILWLHGGGEVGNDNKLQLIHLHHIITYLTGEKKRDFFLLVPQAPRDHGNWDASSYTRTLPQSLTQQLNDSSLREKILEQYKSAFGSESETSVSLTEIDGATVLTVSQPFEDSPLGFSFAMLDQVIRNYPVDTDRITVSGLSTGGDGTWRALERRSELFAAAVPLVSWRALTDEALQKYPVLKKIPIWAIYSSDDSGIDSARADFERVEKAGCNVKKSEFGICGHNAWTPAMLQADIFSWLLSRAKKDGEYIAVVDANVNPDDLKGIVDVATRDPGKPKLAPAPPQTVQKTEKETVKTESKPAATFSVPQQEKVVATTLHDPFGKTAVVPQPQHRVTTIQYRDAAGNLITETRNVTQNVPVINDKNVFVPVNETFPVKDKDELYTQLAMRYFNWNYDTRLGLEGFSRTFVKLSPAAQRRLAEKLLQLPVTDPEHLLILEKMVDQIPSVTIVGATTTYTPYTSTSTIYTPVPVTTPIVPLNVPAKIPSLTPDSVSKNEPPQFTAQRGEDNEVSVTGKVIEDCDRPWAMTSDSLYGMFPADWNKEAKKIPAFIVELDSGELAKKLAVSVSGNGQDFTAACQSILALENKPMSSPWFETGGGRLRSDIRYTLSVKGQMFVRLLKTVKDSTGSDEKNNRAKLAQKTLEKIELILE